MFYQRAYHLYLLFLRDEVSLIRKIISERENYKRDQEEYETIMQRLKYMSKEIPADVKEKGMSKKKKRKKAKLQNINFKVIKRIKVNQIAHRYFESFRMGLEIINYRSRKKILKNLWNRLGVDILEAYNDYYNTNKKSTFTTKLKMISIWKRFMVKNLI